jgi:hypothetical protein
LFVGSIFRGLLLGITLSDFIAGLLLVFTLIAGLTNYKEAYDEKDASNKSEQDVHEF